MSTAGEPSSARGAPGRVAVVHAQTRRGLLVAAVFVVAAVVAAIARAGEEWWVPLHLFVVGGLISAISAATQMLAVTWSASPPPGPLFSAVQRWAVAIGAVLLVSGRESESTGVLATGGVIVIVAILALAVSLLRVRHQAVTDRYAPAIEAYALAVVAGTVGMGIGVALGTGHVGRHAAELRNAHLVVNLFGFVGLVIAGTLPFFTATQVRAKMSRRATPSALRATFGSLAVAVVLAATGELMDRPGLLAVGLFLYAVGLVVIVAMLPIYPRSRLEWAGPRAIQLLVGVGWWTVMTVALGVARLSNSDDAVVLRTLIVGGFAQILIASLAYFGPVLRGGGHQRLSAGFVTTRSWLSLAAGNSAALASLADIRPLLGAALVVWLLDLVLRTGRLLRPT